MLLFSPDVTHGGIGVSTEKVSFLWVHIEAEDVEALEFLTSLPRLIRAAEPTPFPSEMRRLLHRASSDFYEEDVRDLSAAALVMEYFALAKERELYGNDTGLINRMREWIRINSDLKLTVTDVAREFGYNEDYVTRVFKKKTGESLKVFIDRLRMNLLRTRLTTGDTPLKELARDAGFDDYKAFLKFFTYHEGTTPTEFRESCRKTHRNKR